MSQTSRDRRVGAPSISTQDRVLDLLALLLLLGGIALFAIGRSSLLALADNRYQAPPDGVTWVSRAERHDAQTSWGIRLALAGLVLGAGAAMKHAAARRRRSLTAA
jgi:hypothetical protein